MAARLWHLGAVCLNGDEIFSVILSRRGWQDLVAGAAADSVHPPLFYCLLKLWTFVGGESLIWLRLLPALFAVLSILPLIFLGRELRLRPVEINCAIGLASVHPFLVYYSQHDRMYSLLLLCALTSMWLFHRTIRAGGRRARFGYLALTLANIVLVYSHYFGCLIVALEFLYVLLWKRERWKQALLSSLIVLVAFTPWLYMAGTRAYAKGGLHSNLDWIAKPTFADLIVLFVDMTGFGDSPSVGRRVGGAIILLVAAAMWVQWRRRHTRSLGHALHFLLFFTLSPVAVSFIASRLMPDSVWGRRHLIFVAVTLLLLTSVPYWRLRSRTVRLVGALVCAGWVYAVIQHHLMPDDRNTPMDVFVVKMLNQEQGLAGPIHFYAVDRYLHFSVWFYVETLKAQRITGFTLHFTPQELERLSKSAAAVQIHQNVKIEEARGAHFWVATSSYSWKQKTTPQEVMIQRGCRVGPEVKVSDRYHVTAAFPVWCDSVR